MQINTKKICGLNGKSLSEYDQSPYRTWMMKSLFYILLVGCQPQTDDSDIKKQDSGKTGKLTADEIAILYPLKAAEEVDSIFGVTGTGFASTSKVFRSQDSKSLLSRNLFNSFAAKVFGNPCPDTKLSFEPSRTLLKPSIHLSRVKGLTKQVCDYENLRVISWRFDSCLDTDPSDICDNRQARLVVQPVFEDSSSLIILDIAFHLIYKIPDPPAMIARLLQLKAIKNEILAANKGSEDSSLWATNVNPSLVRPHPALRLEMNNKAGDGKMATAIKDFLFDFLPSTNLIEITWMTSSKGATEWTFGAEKIRDDVIVTEEKADFSNFAKSENRLGSYPFSTQHGTPLNIGNLFTGEGLYAKDLSLGGTVAEEANQVLRAGNDPRTVSQADDIECFTCHLPVQVERQLLKLNAKINPFDQYLKIEIWPGFNIKNRSFENFRGFGYWTGFQFGVNYRVLAEVAQELEYLNR